MVKFFASAERLTKRENGKTADERLGRKIGACCSLGARTVQSHRLNYSSSGIELFSPPARSLEKKLAKSSQKRRFISFSIT